MKKIRITKEPPIAEDVRPAVGDVLYVHDTKTAPDGKAIYMVRVGKYWASIGIAEDECEVVDGGED